jgi:predicted GIY-YIG superfamily endonuclease
MTTLTPKSYYCYIITNEHDRTYNGYTVNLERRLRQHNGELKGGAKATRGRGPWSFLAVLTSECWDCISTATQHEWSIKYPTRRRPRPKAYNGASGRLSSLTHVFKHMEKLGCEKVVCYVRHEHLDHTSVLGKPFSSFVTVRTMDELSLRRSDPTLSISQSPCQESV